MKTVMPEISKVAKASTNSKSLRATIPEKIVNELDIQTGDILVWSVESKGNKKIISIEKWVSQNG